MCIGNYGTVLDVIHFIGLGTGKRETRSTSYFIATVPRFSKKITESNFGNLSNFEETAFCLEQNIGAGPLRMKTYCLSTVSIVYV